MSTQITAIYDSIVTTVSGLLSSYIRLQNPYDLSDNTEGALRKGWGIAVGTSTNSNRQVSCHVSQVQTIRIVISRQMYASDLNVSAKADAQKNLLEDLFLVIKEYSKEEISLAGNEQANINYIGHDGIEEVFVKEKHYIKIEGSFVIEYFETLN
jgi:hypothetical protein